MSVWQALGALMITLPFIGIFALGVRDAGVVVTAMIFAAVCGVAVLIAIGVALVQGVIP